MSEIKSVHLVYALQEQINLNILPLVDRRLFVLHPSIQWIMYQCFFTCFVSHTRISEKSCSICSGFVI
ncbi:hypothetical protein D3C85_1758110 [compost metagenome]